jgi:hypothetical protein
MDNTDRLGVRRSGRYQAIHRTPTARGESLDINRVLERDDETRFDGEHSELNRKTSSWLESRLLVACDSDTLFVLLEPVGLEDV